MSASIGIFCIETRKKYGVLLMASWLIGAPGERGNSRLHRQFMQERVEAKPALCPATIEMIAAATTTPATKTKLNLSAIKSRVHTNERARANVVR